MEQLGLLRIDYRSLADCCQDDDVWSAAHDLLAKAKPNVREGVSKLLLETMRRHLCIKTRYLDPYEQEQIKNRSHNSLREPWGFSEDERLKAAYVFLPQRMPANWRGEFRAAFASYRSRLGRLLRRSSLWGGSDNPDLPSKFTEETYDQLVQDLFAALQTYGIVEPVEIKGLGTGYRVNADALRWTRSGCEATTTAAGQRITDNRFFRSLYEHVAETLRHGDRLLHKLEAREHTAQVEPEIRENREIRFRAAELPILFCSPTMELGVDIAELNTVYMRNMPPTPANYAQRSGRAGRSGQPALVVSYAAAKSPHDQYFFQNPIRMVAGSVNPPTSDLANEDQNTG